MALGNGPLSVSNEPVSISRPGTPAVALATWEELPALSDSDRVLAAELSDLGATVTPAVWSNPSIRWAAFDAVVVRSTWDYHLRGAEFETWLDGLDALRVNVFNTTATIRWNMNKGYLRGMAGLGVQTLPTIWLERGSTVSLADAMRERGWHRAVIKPSMSASGWNTRIVGLEETADAEHEARSLIDDRGLLVQPFADEVVIEGEWSFVFIDGALQVSVLKNAKAGDFRVQSNFGGRAAPAPAPRGLAEQAAEVLRRAAPDALYARVDGINRNGTFVLMELELIEPELFMAHEPNVAAAFARALLARLG